jgi:hypothetical protein
VPGTILGGLKMASIIAFVFVAVAMACPALVGLLIDSEVNEAASTGRAGASAETPLSRAS